MEGIYSSAFCCATSALTFFSNIGDAMRSPMGAKGLDMAFTYSLCSSAKN